MRVSTFRRIVMKDTSDLLEQFLGFLEVSGTRYCVIGGQAVNAYVEPLVSLDLDVVVAVKDANELALQLRKSFKVVRFPHSLNVSLSGSDLRIQVQTDERYVPFIERARRKNVLGRRMFVADIADVLQGKIWAALDPEGQGSKRQKDLADIARILETYPAYRDSIPPDLLSRLL